MAQTLDHTSKAKGTHALVFISIIYGLCILQFFEVWGLILRTGTLRTFLLPPSILTIAASLLLIEFWWASYEVTERIGSKFFNFLLSILETLLFFLISAILKSIFEKQGLNSDEILGVFTTKSSVLFSLGIIINVLFIVEDWKRKTRVADFFRATGAVLCLIPILFGSMAVQYVFSYALLVSILSFTIVKAVSSHEDATARQ